MTWQLAGLLGPHHRSGVDGHGWLWEIHRESEARRVLVEVSGAHLRIRLTGVAFVLAGLPLLAWANFL